MFSNSYFTCFNDLQLLPIWLGSVTINVTVQLLMYFSDLQVFLVGLVKCRYTCIERILIAMVIYHNRDF